MLFIVYDITVMLKKIATGFSSLLLSQKSEKLSKIIDEIEAFQKMKRDQVEQILLMHLDGMLF